MHEEMHDTIDLLIHDELTEEEKAKLLSHIAQCDECKKEYESALDLKKRFDGFVEKSDRSLADSVVSEIRKECYPEKKTPFLVRHMGLAASFVFIAILAVYTGISQVRKDNSDMYISEAVTPVTGVGTVLDVKNSAPLISNSAFGKVENFSESVKSEYVTYDRLFSEETAMEAPAPEPEATPDASVTEEMETVEIYIEKDLETILPLLQAFEIIETGENYIVVKREDYEEIKKILELN